MPRKKEDTTLLLDGDVLAWQAAAGVEKVVQWNEDLCFPVASLTDATAALDYRLEWLADTLHTNRFRIFLSDESHNTFRKRLNPDYKSNRVGKPRPLALGPLKSRLLSPQYGAQVLPGLEADDCLGILGTTLRNAIIVSIDKDFHTVPAPFFNTLRPEEGVLECGEAEADRWFMVQTLAGDSVDGYPGCPGIGVKRACVLLEPCAPDYRMEAMWPVVLEAYARQGLGREYALLMARMARILRRRDWDSGRKRVRLWQPPEGKHIA